MRTYPVEVKGEDLPLFNFPNKTTIRARAELFKKRYTWFIIAMALFCIYTIVLSYGVRQSTIKQVRKDMAIEYASQLEAYKRQQAEAVQKEHWLSGTASRDAAINQAVDAVAPVIARLNTDEQKQTEVGIMEARVMNPGFPNSFQEVAGQADQWPLYDGTNRTYTQHDKDIAESIIRPYMESGILPLDLTSEIVYAEWSPNDLRGRDNYYEAKAKVTWRFHGF